MLVENETSALRVLDSVTKIVSVYLEKNSIAPELVAGFIDGVFNALQGRHVADETPVQSPVRSNEQTAIPVLPEAAASEPEPAGPVVGDSPLASSAMARSSDGTPIPVASEATDPTPEPLKPAVPISQSVTDDYIVCLEDGKKLKVLKRYLSTKYGLTPAQYRKKWGLPHGYPMTAPAYGARRAEVARAMGLGVRRVQTIAAPAPEPVLEVVPAPEPTAPAPETLVAKTAPVKRTSQRKAAAKPAATPSKTATAPLKPSAPKKIPAKARVVPAPEEAVAAKTSLKAAKPARKPSLAIVIEPKVKSISRRASVG